MAPCQDSREKRPRASRASPSARDFRILNGELSTGRGAIPLAARMFSSSPVPTTASTSGIFFFMSSRKRSTRQPATTSLRARPEFLCRAISRMVLTDSCWALAMKEQVLTTRMSASSACGVNWAPACASIPIMTSLSTRFLGHPRLTKPTLGGETDESVLGGGAS